MDLSNLLLSIIIYIVPTKTMLGVDVSKYFIDKVINSNHFTALRVAALWSTLGPKVQFMARRDMFLLHMLEYFMNTLKYT